MGTTLATLSPPKGAKHRRKILGRGSGSGLGTTSGKGQKGQKARAGISIRPYFEGGQLPLQRRIPKQGFKNPFRVEYIPVNVGDLGEKFSAGSDVTVETLIEKGLIPRNSKRVKVLGTGELAHALKVHAHAYSKSAAEKITRAGGSAVVVGSLTQSPSNS